MPKHYLKTDVYTAARQRVAEVLDHFPRFYVSFSGGKDSGVLLNLVLDVAKPAPKKTKKGWRLFPADQPATWDIGQRIGAALRNASRPPTEAGDGTHARPRPHIRRAHWHTFWTGPRDGARAARLKWLPPIPVNVDDPDGLPATVRPVE